MYYKISYKKYDLALRSVSQCETEKGTKRNLVYNLSLVVLTPSVGSIVALVQIYNFHLIRFIFTQYKIWLILSTSIKMLLIQQKLVATYTAQVISVNFTLVLAIKSGLLRVLVLFNT